MSWQPRVKALMEQQGLSVEQLARQAGLNEKKLYGWLNPSCRKAIDNPRGDALAKMAEALGATEAFLRYGEDAAHPATPPPPNYIRHLRIQAGLSSEDLAQRDTVSLFT